MLKKPNWKVIIYSIIIFFISISFISIFISIIFNSDEILNDDRTRKSIKILANSMAWLSTWFFTYLYMRRNNYSLPTRIFSFRVPFYIILAIVFGILTQPLYFHYKISGWMLFSPILSILGAIFASVSEEILFRGMIFDVVVGSEKRKIIISSIYFGVIHLSSLNVLLVLLTFIIGIVFGIFRSKSKSIIPSSIAHSLHNIASAVF